jgi:hypothetical protein
METAKKGLVDLALKVDGKAGTTGSLTIGSTPKNKKGLVDLALDIAGKAQDPKDEADDDQPQTKATTRKKKFALSLGILPSAVGGLLNLGIDVFGGDAERGHRRHKRRARKNESTKATRSASE